MSTDFDLTRKLMEYWRTIKNGTKVDTQLHVQYETTLDILVKKVP
jgi:hypothetical protein